MTPALRLTLAALAAEAKAAADPWWIIGSAAVALVGGNVPDVRDIDVLMSAGDASELMLRLGAGSARREPDGLFKSEVFGIWELLPLPVEIMGGFHYCRAGKWRAVWPQTRVAIAVGDQTVFVPSKDELKSLLLGFGRDKDLARAALIPG